LLLTLLLLFILKKILIIIFTFLAAFVSLNDSYALVPKGKLTAKQKAYTVLKKKCNSCHVTDKPKVIFTLKNMDRYAKKIRRQVFLKKKMPKGTKHNLTAKEKSDLKMWVTDAIKKK